MVIASNANYDDKREHGGISGGGRETNYSDGITPMKQKPIAEDKSKPSTNIDLYGLDPEEIKAINQKVIGLREKQLLGETPAVSRIKTQANMQSRAAAATKAAQGGGNLTAGERSQIKRSASADAGRQLFEAESQSIDKYSNMANNMLANTLGLKFGQEVLDQKMPSNGVPTVICTELYEQGYISHLIMQRDSSFGRKIRQETPHVYAGYIFWAPSVVGLMRKSSVFTKIVSTIAVPWARNMAFGNSYFGKLINYIGMPVCGLIGTIIGGRNAKKTI